MTAIDVPAHPGPRDYTLTGPSSKAAVEAGLAAAEWYHTEVPRKVMKELMQRRDAPALRDTILWIALHVLFAGLAIATWGSWWSVPFWAAYGVLYGLTALVALGMLMGGMGWKATIPFLVIGLPRVYGCWHMVMCGLLQHGGLAEDVVDHRLNSRTVYMNPVSRWIYWNMNYHVEHHMFPMVPYYNLPALHEAIKHDLPPPNPSIGAAYREMWGAVMRQRREPGWYLRRELPASARPYRDDLHRAVPERMPA